jgi:hypothetical protein
MRTALAQVPRTSLSDFYTTPAENLIANVCLCHKELDGCTVVAQEVRKEDRFDWC